VADTAGDQRDIALRKADGLIVIAEPKPACSIQDKVNGGVPLRLHADAPGAMQHGRAEEGASRPIGRQQIRQAIRLAVPARR